MDIDERKEALKMLSQVTRILKKGDISIDGRVVYIFLYHLVHHEDPHIIPERKEKK